MSRWLELALGAELRAARTVCGLVEVALGALGLDPALRHDVTLALAEVITNVVEHEYAGAPGLVRLRLEVTRERLWVEVESQGPAFDLVAAVRRAAERDPLEGLQGSGLGLVLVGSLFDEVKSDHEPGRGNVVKLVKRLPA